jgi:predicted nucleic acid-binding protein
MAASAQSLVREAAARGQLVVCAVVYAELSAFRRVTATMLDDFLRKGDIELDRDFSRSCLFRAGKAQQEYLQRRKHSGEIGRRGILADFLIGAHALDRADRLLTFNARDYRSYFPGLTLVP